MYQDHQKIYTIRTMACDICERYDSILISKEELETKVYNNSLHIGSKILSHDDHLRIVYFDDKGTYLGDTMSLNISEQRLANPADIDVPYLTKNDNKESQAIHRRMLRLFTNTKQQLTIVGPSMAGKTSLTMFLNTGIPERHSQRINHPPTMGKSIKRFKLGSNSLTVFDLGGQRDFWNLWKDSMVSSKKIIFVLDGAANNLQEIREALDLIATNISEKQSLLILFNKLDLYLEGYSQSFITPSLILKEFNPSEDLDYWVLETSVYNGIVYNYNDNQEESPLSTAIIDFLNR